MYQIRVLEPGMIERGKVSRSLSRGVNGGLATGAIISIMLFINEIIKSFHIWKDVSGFTKKEENKTMQSLAIILPQIVTTHGS